MLQRKLHIRCRGTERKSIAIILRENVYFTFSGIRRGLEINAEIAMDTAPEYVRHVSERRLSGRYVPSAPAVVPIRASDAREKEKLSVATVREQIRECAAFVAAPDVNAKK